MGLLCCLRLAQLKRVRRVFSRGAKWSAKGHVEANNRRVSSIRIHHLDIVKVCVFVTQDACGGIDGRWNEVLVLQATLQRERRVVSTASRPVSSAPIALWLWVAQVEVGARVLNRTFKDIAVRLAGHIAGLVTHQQWRIHW